MASRGRAAGGRTQPTPICSDSQLASRMWVRGVSAARRTRRVAVPPFRQQRAAGKQHPTAATFCAVHAFPIPLAPGERSAAARWANPVAGVNYWPPRRPSSSSCTSRVGIRRRGYVDGLLDSVSLTRALCAAPISSARCPSWSRPSACYDRPGFRSRANTRPSPLSGLRPRHFTSFSLPYLHRWTCSGGGRNTEALALRIPALVLW